MLKALGAFLCLIGGALWGMERTKFLALREKELFELSRSAETLSGLVCRFLEPLPEALRRAEGDTLSIFSGAAEKIESGMSAGDAFSFALDQEMPYLHLAPDETECLYRFSHGLSAVDTVGQKQNFEMLFEELKRQSEIAHEERIKKGKLYRVGGVLLGGLLGLFLW